MIQFQCLPAVLAQRRVSRSNAPLRSIGSSKRYQRCGRTIGPDLRHLHAAAAVDLFHEQALGQGGVQDLARRPCLLNVHLRRRGHQPLPPMSTRSLHYQAEHLPLLLPLIAVAGRSSSPRPMAYVASVPPSLLRPTTMTSYATRRPDSSSPCTTP